MFINFEDYGVPSQILCIVLPTFRIINENPEKNT